MTDLNESDLAFFLSCQNLAIAEPSQDIRQRNLEYFTKLAEQHCSFFEPNSLKASVHFSITEGEEINGRAFAHKSAGHEYRIATVTRGAFTYVHDFFSYLLSRIDVLPSVGCSAMERNLPHCFIPSRRNPAMEPLLARNLTFGLSPNCPKRREFATWMIFSASRFLVDHEISHCGRGHVGSASLNLDMFSMDQADERNSLLKRHALEMDADAIASNIFFKRCLADLKEEPKFSWSPMRIRSFPTGRMLYPGMIGIFLLFRILARPEDLKIDEQVIVSGSHPHPTIRGI